MAFGQSPGPAATTRQLRELLDLVHEAGHEDLRDARGPLGLTQRQAAGKFTRDEADTLIDRLQQEASGEAVASTPRVAASGRLATAEESARALSSELLAAELQRRGWVVMEP